jgi:hypothetical protein
MWRGPWRRKIVAMSPAPVTPSALDRSTYAAASPGSDSFYVEPPSVPPGLTIGEYRRRRSGSSKPARRRHPIAFALMLTR